MTPPARRLPTLPRPALTVAAITALIAASVAATGLVAAPAMTPPPIADPATPDPTVTATLRAALPSATLISGRPTMPAATIRMIGPTARPTKVPTPNVATRVVVADLGIDLPVVLQATTYPACGVAMYVVELDQPGAGPTGVTYLYAHAQAGMFLPLLQASLVDDVARMVGMLVEVYTGDNVRHTYRIDEVRRHVTTMDGAYGWTGPESVWLQTSEGRGATVPKLQVVATLVSRAAADPAAAHPEPHPVSC